jgi:hypothetical protein
VIAHRSIGVACVAACLLFSSAARADFIVGQVVDSQGVGVPGVNIDAIDLLGGVPPLLMNDGTDANGFFTTTIPSGFFTLVFIPPPPPVTNLLPTAVGQVVVVGTANLGTVTVPDGLVVQGRVVYEGLLPASGVDLTLLDQDDPNALPVEGQTNAFGQFSLACAQGTYDFRLDPQAVPGATLAPREFTLPVSANVNLRDVVLEPGFHVTAIILQPGGLPLVNADVDVDDWFTGESVWTPHDNSDVTGLVDVVLAEGVYDFKLCPALSTGLAAVGYESVGVDQDFFAGILTAQQGVLLTGLVNDTQANVLKGIDLDLVDSATGQELALCGDNTDASGIYAVIAPPGSWDVRFTPPHSQPYGSKILPSVNIGAPTVVLHTTLPDCPPFIPYGFGLKGTGGLEPDLKASGGSARLGNDDYKFEISNALGGAHAVLLVGLAPAATQFSGSILFVAGAEPPGPNEPVHVEGFQEHPLGGTMPYVGWPFQMHLLVLRGPVGVAGAGRLTLPDPIPSSPALSGVSRFAQLLVWDPGASVGWAFSHGIQIPHLE